MRGTLRVLFVEDDPAVAEAVSSLLAANGYEVRCAATGRSAVSALEDESFDACVLDVMLPDISGVEVLREIRPLRALPVLLLTARSSSRDKVHGLDAGADDYLVKPFDPPELLARLRALLRRAGRLSPQKIALGACVLDPATHTLRRGGRAVELTAREEQLLEALASVPGKVWTRSQLLEAVWRDDLEVGDRSVDSAVKRLRRKIEGLDADAEGGPDDSVRLGIRTLYGLGYRLDGIRW